MPPKRATTPPVASRASTRRRIEAHAADGSVVVPIPPPKILYCGICIVDGERVPLKGHDCPVRRTSCTECGVVDGQQAKKHKKTAGERATKLQDATKKAADEVVQKIKKAKGRQRGGKKQGEADGDGAASLLEPGESNDDQTKSGGVDDAEPEPEAQPRGGNDRDKPKAGELLQDGEEREEQTHAGAMQVEQEDQPIQDPADNGELPVRIHALGLTSEQGPEN